MSRWGLLALIAIGCGHGAPAPAPKPVTPVVVAADAAVPDSPPPLDEDPPRLAARAVEMWRAWRKAFEDAGEDCAAATKAMNEVADRYSDVIDANQKVLHAGRERVKALREALEPYDAELEEAARAVAHSKAMAACVNDPAFAKAVDRIGGE